MKARLASVLLLAAALCPTAFPATPDYPTPVEFPVSNALMQGSEIKPGTTEKMVVKAFGKPDQRLSSDLWVYRAFHSASDYATSDLTTAKRCNILLVQFEQGKVASLKLVNKRAVETVIATLALDRTKGNVASTK